SASLFLSCARSLCTCNIDSDDILFSEEASEQATLAFAFSQPVWHCSAHAEVFALNNALCAWLLAATAVFFSHESRKRLSASDEEENDVVSCVLMSVSSSMRLPRLCRQLCVPALFFLLGLLPYAYLPWAARRGAPTSWGGRDVATLSGFVRSTPSTLIPPHCNLSTL
ncbi:MAG: protein O-mannosyl-transferase family, partial [Promethearchaeia archaeon]